MIWAVLALASIIAAINFAAAHWPAGIYGAGRAALRRDWRNYALALLVTLAEYGFALTVALIAS